MPRPHAVRGQQAGGDELRAPGPPHGEAVRELEDVGGVVRAEDGDEVPLAAVVEADVTEVDGAGAAHRGDVGRALDVVEGEPGGAGDVVGDAGGDDAERHVGTGEGLHGHRDAAVAAHHDEGLGTRRDRGHGEFVRVAAVDAGDVLDLEAELVQPRDGTRGLESGVAVPGRRVGQQHHTPVARGHVSGV